MYLNWNEQTITDFSEDNISSLYNNGYVFTRVGKGVMNQTRSVRIDLSTFALSSENKRILRKTEDLHMQVFPLPYEQYSWEIGKLAKDFYDTKFGDGVFSANKIKGMLTDPETNNFNRLFVYETKKPVGYAIGYENTDILHYSYPFYDLTADKNTGMSMMVRAVAYAKESEKKYIYLGSAQRPGDTYKFQFSGMEWFDGNVWSDDLDQLKSLLKQTPTSS